MTAINTRANSDKRRLEGNVHTMQAEIDDMLHAAKASEEKAKKAMVDAARLADELRAEQDHVTAQTNAKRALESSMGELEQRLAEANENAMRGGRAAMAKLESRIRELETELGNVQAPTSAPSARSRSWPSRTTRTARTRTACPTWPTSCRARSRPTRSRSRRPRRLLPSTWPSSARPSRSSRRPRTAPGSPKASCLSCATNSAQDRRAPSDQQQPALLLNGL